MRDGLTISPEGLREQWKYLKDHGYECISLDRFLAIARAEQPQPSKCFLLTFDDGYQNNLQFVYPLLKEFSWEATLFIIAGTLNGSYKDPQTEESSRKLSVEELKSMIGSHICLGLHGYQHENFSEISLEEQVEAIRKSCEILEDCELDYTKVLAYPYGARPKNSNDFFVLKAWMSEYGIEAAFRIGNRPQRVPVLDFYEINRIDIRGTDSLDDFKIKLHKGKLKPF